MEYLSKRRADVRERILRQSGVRDVLAQKTDPRLYARYLTNVWHYAQHSSIVIGLAGARCVPKHPRLADYLLHHAREELGHDQWALDDLAALGVKEEHVRASRPVPACAAMIGFEYYVSGHTNPVGLFGWLFVLEAIGEDLGHLVADHIKGGLDLPQGVKFLAGHGEADKEHTKDLIQQIDQYIHGADLEDVHYVADVVGDLYVRMFQEIAEGR